jgi:hypothetical protein
MESNIIYNSVFIEGNGPLIDLKCFVYGVLKQRAYVMPELYKKEDSNIYTEKKNEVNSAI